MIGFCMLRTSKFDNYSCWKTEINRLVYSRFFNPNSEFSDYNDEGYYFLVPKSPIYNETLCFSLHPVKRPRLKSNKINYSKIDDLKIPKDWLSFEGLKIGMFSPENWFGLTLTPVSILRFYFKKGYRLYNRENLTHVSLWNNFVSGSKNDWKKIPGLVGILKKKLCPSHPEFYHKYKFAGYLGYSDLIMSSILVSNAIEKIEVIG